MKSFSGKNICFPQFTTHSPNSILFGVSHDTSLFCHIVCLPGLFVPPFNWCWSCPPIPAYSMPSIHVAGSHTRKGSIYGSCWSFYDCSIQCWSWFATIICHFTNVTVYVRTVRSNLVCDHCHRRYLVSCTFTDEVVSFSIFAAFKKAISFSILFIEFSRTDMSTLANVIGDS